MRLLNIKKKNNLVIKKQESLILFVAKTIQNIPSTKHQQSYPFLLHLSFSLCNKIMSNVETVYKSTFS